MKVALDVLAGDGGGFRHVVHQHLGREGGREGGEGRNEGREGEGEGGGGRGGGG